MSIVSKHLIEANGYKVKMKDRLRFYKGDTLNLHFIISNKMIAEINSTEVINGILPIDSPNIKAFMLVGGKSMVVGTIIENNEIIFRLEPENQTVGTTQLQIVIKETLDDGETDVLHTPPFPIDIAEPLIDINANSASVGYAVVGTAVVGNDSSTFSMGRTATVNISDNYEITVWRNGDIITEAKLNKIEQELLNHANKLAELLYVTINVSNLTLSKTIAEMGEVVSNLRLTWDYNKTPISQVLNNIGLDVDVREYVETANISANKIYEIKASDGKKSTSKAIEIKFLNGKYYGVAEEGVYDSSFILNLTKTLTDSKNGDITVNCGNGQFVYYCIPTRFGNPIFSVGGFDGGFIKVDTIEFTNAYGYTEEYGIWKSENANLGTITINVR